MNKSNLIPEKEPVMCMRCNVQMVRIKMEEWTDNNLLLKQLQKLADHAGVRVYHCKSCGKIEFFR